MIVIEEIISKVLRDDHEKNKRDGAISISKLGGCLRQMIMSERGYDKKEGYVPFTDRQLRVFKVGYQFEYFTLDLLKDVELARQIPAEYRGIKGTADFIAKDSPKNILLDVKSCHSQKFKYLQDTPDEHYAMQLATYYFALKDKYNLSPIVRLVYEDKDNLMIKEIGFNAENLKEKVDDKINKIALARNNEELPEELPLNEKGDCPWQCFTNSKKNGVRLWCQYIFWCPRANAKYQDALSK